MTFSIITPAFKQTDWLRLCVLSVADQVVPEACGIVNSLLNIDDSEAGRAERSRQLAISNQQSAIASPLRVEHIIQDAGSPGIEAFAREMASHLLQKYGGEEIRDLAPCEILHLRAANGYTLRIFKEPDAGMYDAINRGLAKSTGEICAWLNCDEQYLPETLRRVEEMFKRRGTMDVLLGDAVLLNETHEIVSYRRIMRPSRWHTKLVHLHSLSCAMFFKKSILPEPALDPRWKIISDAVLMDYFLSFGKKVVASSQLLSVYCFTGENLSAKPSGELYQWWRETKWPPRLFRMPVVMIHRIRRLCHGAYKNRDLKLSIYRNGDKSRSLASGKVDGLWPKPHSSEKLIYHGLSGVTKRLSFLSDQWFSRLQYLYKFKRFPNLRSPRTFNEKLQWMKLFHRDPLITACANKSSVREYVRKQWGDDILIPQIREYTAGTEFKLSDLPDRFVLKAAHASGWNYICTRKSEADEASIKGLIDAWVRADFSTIGREAMYRGSKQVAVCEEFLDGGEGKVPRDYKFFCFHGEPRFVQVDYDRFSGHTRTLYDMEWKRLNCEFEYPYGPDETGHPPEPFKRMAEIARKLSAPFSFVRVDLYESGGRVWFGEMTFCPEKACGRFNPKKYDLEFGKFLDLTQISQTQAAQKPITVPVIGTQLLATSYTALSDELIRCATESKVPIAVDFANTHIVTMRRHDPDFAKLSECIDLTLPDGMPLVWLMNREGAGLKDRVYGPTFTREFLASCPAGMTHYLVGGSEECGRRFRERMLALNPTLGFVGGYHGKCSPEGLLEDDDAVMIDILEKRPDFIWVGLGTPKQYGWINRIKPKLDHGVMLAVGFAFDVNAGMKPDAPAWMQRAGLTWLYRMASEPRRLVGRYLKWNSLFLFYVGAEPMFPSLLRMKLSVRNFCLRITDLFASEIKDCVTGESLGRGLFVSWGGRPWVIGHKGLPPLIPRFLPQKRLTYWKQAIGFTTHERPDFPRLDGVAPTLPNKARVINVVLTHLGSDKALSQLLGNWKGVCRPEDLWIAFGGSRRDFEALDYSRKVFVEDPNLRREDNQRQKQSYTGIFHAMKAVVEAERADSIYLCEYDHLPLVHDLNARQVDEMNREGADVMGHWLYRVDGSSHYHMLYHETDPSFLPFWESVSCREDRGVVLSMFGSGSMWSRNAFLAVASRPQEIPCYLELYLPTMAHHLGFRVRGWNESDHLLSNLPSRSITMESARASGCLTVHPVKALGKI